MGGHPLGLNKKNVPFWAPDGSHLLDKCVISEHNQLDTFGQRTD